MDRPQYIILVKQKGREIGVIEIETFPDVAPKHSEYFDRLVQEHRFDGTVFHRIIPGLFIQGGDLNSRHTPRYLWGQSDNSTHGIPAEFSSMPHIRGTLSAARSQDINSANSQFFICLCDATFLDGQYSVYGQVIKGMEIAESLQHVPRDNYDIPNEKIEVVIRRKLAEEIVSQPQFKSA